MELSDFNDKQKALMDAKDRKQFGKRALTYDEVEEQAGDRLEKELHDQYFAYLHRNGFTMRCIIHAPMYKKSALPPGWPDFTVFYRGHTLFIEFKVGKNTTSTTQDFVISGLREQGFPVFVLYTLEDAQRETKAFFNL